jgi:hypothetical protein
VTEINFLLDESLRKILVVIRSIDENGLQSKPKNRSGSDLHDGYAMMYALVDNQCRVSLFLSSPLTSCLNHAFSFTFRLSFNLWLLTNDNAYPTPQRLILFLQLLVHRCDLSILCVTTKLFLSRMCLRSLSVLFVICVLDVSLFLSMFICVLCIFLVRSSTTE